MKHMIKWLKKVPLLLVLTLSIWMGWLSASSGEEKLIVEQKSLFTCFGNNEFVVTAPETGKLTITVCTNTSVYRTICADVEAGENRIQWDGLGYNQEKLYPMNYNFDAELISETGNIYNFRFEAPVDHLTQALTLALPSSDTIYLNHPKEWFLECKVIQEGTLITEMIPVNESEPVWIFRSAVQPGKINHLTFADLSGKRNVNPGSYSIHLYEMSRPEYSKDYLVTVAETKPDSKPVSVTGPNMPERGCSDEEIWEYMIQPAVVVDIKNTNHQIVYERPDPTSDSLGTLHGQTQTLYVVDIQDEWALVEAWNHEEGEKIRGWVPYNKLKIEKPNTEYGLLVDKQEQTISVFHQGKRIETILVSTGRMLKNQLYQETAAGSFLTGEHRVDYSTNGNKYDFVIQYDGGNLIHQVPYAFGERKKDFTEGRALLGAKASHACIRIQAEPGAENGINAYWIWTHIPYHSRVIILDDPEERKEMKAILTAEQEKSVSEKKTYAVEDEEDSVIMTFGGDAVLGGREAYYFRDDSLMAYVAEKGAGYPFSGLKDYFASDDITSVNLECVLKPDKTGEDTGKEWRFRGIPEYAEILKEGSVEIVNLANNHTMDYGKAGYQSTVEAVEKVAEWCGKGHPAVVDVKGHKIGFGGCREMTYKLDPGIIEREIQIMKDIGCECIIYQCHWGKEYSTHFNAIQQSMAHACIRAGADLVIGHHPHVVQGIDYIGGTPVVYSLGNLCFGGTIQLSGYDAALARVVIKFGDGRPEVSIRMIPILTSSMADQNKNDFHPVPASGDDADRILQIIQSDSGVDVPK